MSRMKNFFHSTFYPALLLTLSTIGLVLFYAGRMNWIFIELNLGKEGILHLIFPILVVNAILLCVLTILRRDRLIGDEKWYSALLSVSSVFSFFTTIFGIVEFIIALTGE